MFALPLGEFTSARNALAAQLKKAGRQNEADALKALPKPPVSAWAVNQLYWRHRESFDRLLETGERLRRAQASQAAGDSVRELASERRAALAGLAARAEEILRDGGFGATRDMLRRITATLEALSAQGDLPNAPRAGRLAADVDAPGFDAMAALFAGGGAAKRAPSARPAAAPDKDRRSIRDDLAARRDAEERKRRVAAARAEVREADRTLRAARKRAERADAALAAAAKRVKESHAVRVEIERQLARAAEKAKSAHEQARAAEADTQSATQAAATAERELDLARGRLRELTS